MLAPDERSVLLDLLRPPVGHVLDRAVGTTFTLDLQAALAVPLAFASQRLSSTTDPIAVMEAVRSAAGRIDVFAQVGQIRVPSTHSDLMAFLEPMVHEVSAPRPGHLFHPKVWLLRFVAEEGAEEPHQLRLVCLTRNLTSDASWDAALRVDGWESSRPRASNRPVADLLLSLPRLLAGRRTLDRARRLGLEELAESVRHAEWEWPDGVSEGIFHVLGLDPRGDRPDFRGRSRVVIAPFCDDAGLDLVAPVGSGDITVVAGARNLDRLSPRTLARIEPYVVHAAADLSVPDDDPDGDAEPVTDDRAVRGGLHAKVTVVDRGRQAIVFIGSANATGAAYGGNVEVLVELRGSSAKLGVAATLDDVTGLGSIVERHSTAGGVGPDPAEDAHHELVKVLRRLADRRWTMTAAGSPEGWDLTVATATPVPTDGCRVTVEMLSRPGRALTLEEGAREHGAFPSVALADISPFLVIRAERDDPSHPGLLRAATVVKAVLRNDPEGRLDEILARQIDAPEKLVRFLILVLGLGPIDPVVVGDGSAAGSAVGGWGPSGASTGLFEALVRGLADQREGFEDIARLIERLRATDRGRAALQPGFDGLWTVICDARRIVADSTALRRATRR